MADNERPLESPEHTPAVEPQVVAAESAEVGSGTESATPEAGAPEPAAADSVEVQDPAALVAALTAERDQLTRERDEYYDLLLRRSAEFENYRRRVDRERREMLELAGMDVVRELLPILDDFERALKTETTDRDYARGIELIYQRLMETLKKIGLEPMTCQGQKFDPHQHEAIEMTPTEEYEDHTIIEEYRRGYNFRGRLLRPALVRVAVKPDSNGRGQA